jgi:hypothetical protein
VNRPSRPMARAMSPLGGSQIAGAAPDLVVVGFESDRTATTLESIAGRAQHQVARVIDDMTSFNPVGGRLSRVRSRESRECLGYFDTPPTHG